MSHFLTIISAPLNCEISWSPKRASQPTEPVKGVSKPNCSPTVMADEIGIALMFWTPPATTRSAVPLITACAAVDRLLGRAALAVDRHARDVKGQVRGQPAGAGDVAGLGADRVAAAEDDVVDGVRVDARALHQTLEDVGAEVGGVDGRESAVAAADGRTDRLDEIGLSHFDSPWGRRSGRRGFPLPSARRRPMSRRAPAGGEWGLACAEHRRAVAEEALVRRDARLGAFDLSLAGLAAELPGELTDLGDRLRGTASPKRPRPPDGLTGIRPPIDVAPSRRSPSASPGLQRPMFSYQSSSRALERS